MSQYAKMIPKSRAEKIPKYSERFSEARTSLETIFYKSSSIPEYGLEDIFKDIFTVMTRYLASGNAEDQNIVSLSQYIISEKFKSNLKENV